MGKNLIICCTNRTISTANNRDVTWSHHNRHLTYLVSILIFHFLKPQCEGKTQPKQSMTLSLCVLHQECKHNSYCRHPELRLLKVVIKIPYSPLGSLKTNVEVYDHMWSVDYHTSVTTYENRQPCVVGKICIVPSESKV